MAKLPTLQHHRHRGLPLLQGELDGLCGVYAVINALSWLIGRRRRVRRTSLGLLFAYLVHALEEEAGALEALIDGIAVRSILTMLGVAGLIVKAEHGVELTVHRPFLRQAKPPLAALITEMREGGIRGDTAYLIGIGGWSNHWSVCIGASAASLRLRDSCGMRHLRLANCRMRHEPSLGTATQYLLSSRECIRIVALD